MIFRDFQTGSVWMLDFFFFEYLRIVLIFRDFQTGSVWMLDFFFGIFKDRFDIQRFSNRKWMLTV